MRGQAQQAHGLVCVVRHVALLHSSAWTRPECWQKDVEVMKAAYRYYRQGEIQGFWQASALFAGLWTQGIR